MHWRHLGLLSQVRADKYEKIDKELLEFVEDVLLNRCENATERMLEYAATLDPKSTPTNVRKKGQVRTRADNWLLPNLGACLQASVHYNVVGGEQMCVFGGGGGWVGDSCHEEGQKL